MNLREAKLSGDGALLGGVVVQLPRAAIGSASAAALDSVTVGIRPEAVVQVASGSPGALTMTVTLVEELGADAYVYGQLPDDPAGARTWVLRCDGRGLPRRGEELSFTIDMEGAHLFNPGTGERLN